MAHDFDFSDIEWDELRDIPFSVGGAEKLKRWGYSAEIEQLKLEWESYKDNRAELYDKWRNYYLGGNGRWLWSILCYYAQAQLLEAKLNQVQAELEQLKQGK